MVSAWKPVLAALVIFAAGAIAGGVVVNLRHKRLATPFNPSRSTHGGRPDSNSWHRPWPSFSPENAAREMGSRMERALDLTPQQKERIQTIVLEAQRRMKVISDEFGPRTREEFRTMREQILKELTPDQAKRFEELFKPRDGRPRRPDGPPPSHGGSPPGDGPPGSGPPPGPGSGRPPAQL